MNSYTSIWNQRSSLHFLIFFTLAAAITIFIVKKANETVAEIEIIDVEIQQRNTFIKRAEEDIGPHTPPAPKPLRLK